MQAFLSLPLSPAIVKNTAWNRAAEVVLTDYASIAPEQRNILRIFFSESCARSQMLDWENHARSMVAAFRSDAVRSGASDSVEALVDDLIRSSPEFAAIWRDHDVQTHGEGTKHFRHSSAGAITLEYSAFAVIGRPDLNLAIYTPSTPMDAERIRSILES